jgi:hypothetical protein
MMALGLLMCLMHIPMISSLVWSAMPAVTCCPEHTHVYTVVDKALEIRLSQIDSDEFAYTYGTKWSAMTAATCCSEHMFMLRKTSRFTSLQHAQPHLRICDRPPDVLCAVAKPSFRSEKLNCLV